MKNKEIQSNELIMQLQEQKKRAEEDKQVALIAMEQASKRYVMEREEKKKLESKIEMMNSQMIVGGSHKMEDSAFKNALEKRQEMLIKELELKLINFNPESDPIVPDKAQVEKYKGLLLKQRDIMIALTTKLNERDEALVQLQEKLETYETIFKEQENLIKGLNEYLKVVQELMSSNNVKFPGNISEMYSKAEASIKSHTRTIESLSNLSYSPAGRVQEINKNDKIYLPFNVEKNEEEYKDSPITMLNADEKISELRKIIEEQEKESEILAKIIHNNLGNKEPNAPLKDEKNSYLVNQNKVLNEHNIILSNKCEELLDEKGKFLHLLKTDMKNSFENIYNNLVADNANYHLSQELLYLYKVMTDFFAKDLANPDPPMNTKPNSSENNNLNQKSNSEKKVSSNITKYNNLNMKKNSNQLVIPQKFLINSLDNNQLINDSLQSNVISSKPSISNYSNQVGKQPMSFQKKEETIDDSIRKVDDSINIRDFNDSRVNYSSTNRFSSSGKSNANNKTDTYINKFLNR